MPFEDGIDRVSPVVTRALALVAEQDRELPITAEPGDEAPPVDHLADIAHVVGGERRVRAHTVLTRLATHNPGEYDGWAFADLLTTLAAHGIQPTKSHGVMVIRADDITAARPARAQSGEDGERGDSAGRHRGGTLGPREKERKPPETRVRHHRHPAPSPKVTPPGAAIDP